MDIRCWRCAKPISGTFHEGRDLQGRPSLVCDPCYRHISAPTLATALYNELLQAHQPFHALDEAERRLQDLPSHLL